MWCYFGHKLAKRLGCWGRTPAPQFQQITMSLEYALFSIGHRYGKKLFVVYVMLKSEMFVLCCPWPSYFFLRSFEEVSLWVSLSKMAPELGMLCSCLDSIHYYTPSQCPVKGGKEKCGPFCLLQAAQCWIVCMCVCSRACAPVLTGGRWAMHADVYQKPSGHLWG